MSVSPEYLEDMLSRIPGVVSVSVEPTVRRYFSIRVTVAPTGRLYDQNYAVAKAWNAILDRTGPIDHDLQINVAEKPSPCTGPG